MDAIALPIFPESVAMPKQAAIGESPQPGASLFGALVAEIAKARTTAGDSQADRESGTVAAQGDPVATAPPPVVAWQRMIQTGDELSLPEGLHLGLGQFRADESEDPATPEADVLPPAEPDPEAQQIVLPAVGRDPAIAEDSRQHAPPADQPSAGPPPDAPGRKTLAAMSGASAPPVRHRDGIASPMPQLRLDDALSETVEADAISFMPPHAALSRAKSGNMPFEAPVTAERERPADTADSRRPAPIAPIAPVAASAAASACVAAEHSVLPFTQLRTGLNSSKNGSAPKPVNAPQDVFPSEPTAQDHRVLTRVATGDLATPARETETRPDTVGNISGGNISGGNNSGGNISGSNISGGNNSGGNIAGAQPSAPTERTTAPTVSAEEPPTGQESGAQDVPHTTKGRPASASPHSPEPSHRFAQAISTPATVQETPPVTSLVGVSSSAGSTADSETPSDVGVKLAPAPQDGRMEALALQIAARSMRGESRFTIRLDPPELGRIDVDLQVNRHGQAQAVLAIEKPQTLDILLRDAPALERALKDAGLELGSDLSFSLKDDSRSRHAPEDHGRFPSQALEVAPAEATNAHSALSAAALEQFYGSLITRLDITV